MPIVGVVFAHCVLQHAYIIESDMLIGVLEVKTEVICHNLKFAVCLPSSEYFVVQAFRLGLIHFIGTKE